MPTNHIDHIYPCKTTLNIINVRIEHVHTTQQVPSFPQKGDSYWTLITAILGWTEGIWETVTKIVYLLWPLFFYFDKLMHFRKVYIVSYCTVVLLLFLAFIWCIICSNRLKGSCSIDMRLPELLNIFSGILKTCYF